MHDFAGGGDGSWAVRLRREGFAGKFEKRKRDRTDCGKYRKQRHFLLYGQSGEITAGLDIDPSMYDPGFEELCDVREKPYGYLLIFSGGFMAVDETLTPVKTVRFSELAWFERKWIFNGDRSFNPYDVSEDFRYLVSLGGVNYIVDLENGNVLLAQKGERERGIVLPDGEVVPGDFRVSGGMVTAAARLAGVENGLNVFSYGIFRFNLSTGEKSFAGLEGVGAFSENPPSLPESAEYLATERDIFPLPEKFDTPSHGGVEEALEGANTDCTAPVLEIKSEHDTAYFLENCCYISCPVCFKAATPELLECVLRNYNGRATVFFNKHHQSIAEKYGAIQIK